MSADFDGDLSDDLVVFRPSSGTWYVLYSEEGFTTYGTQVWGNWYDQPVSGDYDGDGTADHAIWRPTTGEWWIKKSSGGNLTYSLGVPGDVAIPSAFIKQIGGTAAGSELAASRLDPENATGGTDYYSRNFSWGASLVGLPGRAGLDAGLGIGYNSLVWIKTSGSMYFDPDSSNVAPGFRMGFPTIEPIYYNDTRSKWAYMMVTPSGKRVEFLETSVDETFETTDSSYTQLVTGTTSAPNVPSEGVSMTVKTTDGTQMTYSWNTGAYRCTRVKDRNGNYIDITYLAYGKIETITDTLGRVINVNYDEYGRVSTITHNWNASNGEGTASPHTYATLNYTTKTVATSWSVPFYGPPNDTAVTVLDKITYADNSSTKFEYNGYIQVMKVTNVAADTTTNLNYVETDLADVSGSQSDVPRMGETRSWAKDFNGETAVEVTNSAPSSASYDLGGNTGTATKIDVGVTGHPDSLFTRYWFHSSGWKKGLLIGTEDCVSSGCTGTDRKRWTWTNYTQDNTGVSYIVNPRVIESRVGDGSNVKKSDVEYWLYSGTSVAVSGLVKEARVYDTDLSTVLKKTYMEYNLSSEYVASYVIGLPALTTVYGRDEYGLQLVAKTTHAYDEGNFSGSGQTITPVKHDGTNYGSSFTTGRGNLTSVRRWDVNYPTTESASTVSTTKYNTAGSVVSKTSPWYSTVTRTVTIGYTDNFNSSPGVSTYAYPTSVTDPNSQSSTVKYRYDIGANIEANSPAPAGQSHGKTSKRLYDTYGRLERDSVYVNTTEQFYTRYEYPTIGTQSKVYTTITDVTGSTSGPDTADEVLSESFTDGAGRVIKSRTPHTFETNGTTATWSGVKVEYDLLGRVKKQSVPTEVDSSFDPAGDDYARGYLWTFRKYDWKGRVIRKINTDGTDSSTLNDSDILISYEGCGCAGGQVTTIESERVPYGTSSYARRKQKIHEDILGRATTTEVFEWDGTTVSTATVQSFNGRDQVVKTRQYSGSTSSSTYQDVSMTYDGFGRMKTRHYPIEDDETETTWNYNLDDSISQIIDPRLAITDFTYNSLGLKTQTSYTPPNGTSVPDSPTVDYTYDNLGNRTGMDTAGVSNVTYSYDPLSRMLSETTDFDDLSSNLTISYTYNLSGGLKSITDPYSSVVTYQHDKNGRLKEVGDYIDPSDSTTGPYATNIKYRAFGQLKQIDYGLPENETSEIKLEYDNRLRVSHAEASMPHAQSGFVLKADYTYFADSRLAEKNDLLDDAWDRTVKYDFAGRLSHNQFGLGLASGGQSYKRVYQQEITYDGFSQMTSRAGVHWDNEIGFNESYTNGRITGSAAPNYDAAGNIVSASTGSTQYEFQNTIFDASGRRKGTHNSIRGKAGSILNMITETKNEHKVDGDGRPVLELKGSRQFHVNTPPTGEVEVEPWTLQVWSTVLGASLTTVMPSGAKHSTKVYAGGAVIAVENEGIASMKTSDPVTGTVANYVYFESEFSSSTEEQEPLGQNIWRYDPEDPPEPLPSDSTIGSADWPEWQCHAGTGKVGSFDAMPFHCQHKAMLAAGSALPWENEKGSDPKKIPEKPKSGPPTLKKPTEEEKARARALAATQKLGTGKNNESVVECEDDETTTCTREKLFGVSETDDEIKTTTPVMGTKILPRTNEIIFNTAILGGLQRLAARPNCRKIFDDMNGGKFGSASYLADDIYYDRVNSYIFADAITVRKGMESGKPGDLPGGKTGISYDGPTFFTGEYNVGKYEGKHIPIDVALAMKIKGSNITLGQLIGTGSLTVAEYREFIVLHELGHAADKNGVYDDDGTSSKALNELIRKNCF